MEKELIAILSTLKYPVIRQGSLAPKAPYPATFFTFWNNDEREHSAYDNNTALIDYNYDVNCYATDPDIVYNTLVAARELLKAAGWIVRVFGYDAASDEDTHTGRGMEVSYIARNTITEVNQNG